ncbi:MAG: hypothetical protein NVSMB5_20880 [Candidatus Velthaea sp.]
MRCARSRGVRRRRWFNRFNAPLDRRGDCSRFASSTRQRTNGNGFGPYNDSDRDVSAKCDAPRNVRLTGDEFNKYIRE